MKALCLTISLLLLFNPMAQPLIAYNMPETPVICPVIVKDFTSQVDPIIQWNPTVNVCTMTCLQ